MLNILFLLYRAVLWPACRSAAVCVLLSARGGVIHVLPCWRGKCAHILQPYNNSNHLKCLDLSLILKWTFEVGVWTRLNALTSLKCLHPVSEIGILVLTV